METNNKPEITIVSVFTMDKLAVGDIFFFSTTGPKYVFLGRTLDGRFLYMRTDTKRRYNRRRNRQVFNMDADGGLFIANGELFIDYQSAMACATRMETKRNINLELATSAQSLKNNLRNYHYLLIEKYNIDGRTYKGAIHRLYEYLDVIDQLDDLIKNPNPWSDVSDVL